MTDASATPRPLVLSRHLHAAPETVFRAWTEAEGVKQWFCPEGCTIPEAQVEARIGGVFDYLMRIPNGMEHWVRGTIVEIKPLTRLVIDLAVGDGAPLFHALTELDFTQEPGGTRLDVTQTYTLNNPAIAAQMVAGASEGWRTTLDKLAQYVVAQQTVGSAQYSAVHATFELTRRFDAPVSRLWRALTDLDAKAIWFSGPADRCTTVERHMDVRVGGSERLQARWEGGLVTTFDAAYLDVIENERLVYSYAMYLDDRKISVSLATLQLSASGAGTTLTMTEQGAFLDGYDDAGQREHGSGHLLDALGASLAN